MMPFTPKTDRRRGKIYRVIRKVAARGIAFSPLDLPFPRVPTVRNLAALVKRGELAIVRPAGRGHYAQPSLYIATPSLRPATLTNRSL
jgi:molybdopterin-guanine dinucleotide biosynthesis protein A